MSKYNQIKVLSAPADRKKLEPVLEALRARGLSISDMAGKPDKEDIVLAALTEEFYADSSLCGRLLSLIGEGARNILPLQLDGAAIPDALKNALYARNIIPAADREPGQIAERVISALPQRKSRIPLLLVLCAAVLAVIAGAMFYLRSRPAPVEEIPAVTAEVQEPELPSFDIPEGLTPEDLEKVRCVVIVGKHFSYYTDETRIQRNNGGRNWPDMLYELASEDRQESGECEWYWHEDGSRVEMASYDLGFLVHLPNLEELHMAMVDLKTVPDLGGLEHLNVVWAMDCRMDNLNWLSGTDISKAQIRCDVDYTPLGSCKRLQWAVLEALSEKGADFSRFTPPSLMGFDLTCSGPYAADLSGLAGCEQIQNVMLSGVQIRDLSFLKGKKHITQVELDNLRSLQDISGLGGAASLITLSINNCGGITDFSPLSTCRSVSSFRYRADDSDKLRDVSFLSGMKDLKIIDLGNVNLQDINFLQNINAGGRAIEFGYSGNINDLSGLAAVKNYQRLSLDQDPEYSKGLEEFVQYLEGADIQRLILRRFRNPDLSVLPEIRDELELDRCSITDLSALPQTLSVNGIRLNRLQTLSSLNGIQNLSGFGRGSGHLDVYACPRLTDWSALEGMTLSSLEITGGFTLPDFSVFKTKDLRLDSAADIEDLHFLDEMDASEWCSFTLVGLENLRSLEPLGRFHGNSLAVQPQLLEQAEDLVKSGNFISCRAEYPRGGWEQDDMEFTLLSLEELETLPKALLRKISHVCIAGDRVIDPEQYEIWEDWENNRPVPVLHDRGTDEMIPLNHGTIENMDALASLTGLKNLELYYQPLETLDGIQNFPELERVSADYCDRLTDVSAAFTLQSLHKFSAHASAVSSIQGIQNLSELEEIDLRRTQAADLSPLGDVDYEFSEKNGGLVLQLEADRDHGISGNLNALAAIPRFGWLVLNGIDAGAYLEYLDKAGIRGFSAVNSFSDETFAAFIASHPELEDLHIPWNEGIHDLTGLVEMPNLRYVKVSENMQDAVRSLEGQEYDFEFEIEGQ